MACNTVFGSEILGGTGIWKIGRTGLTFLVNKSSTHLTFDIVIVLPQI